jgi:murein DD-endopeptidase MepM/ murein hydrolase activator NlpD
MKKLLAIGERLGGVVRRPRAYLAVALPLAIPLFLASVTAVTPSAAPVMKASIIPLSPRYTDLNVQTPASLPEHSVILTMENGDTLESVLLAGGLDRTDRVQVTHEIGKSVDLRRLRPGNLLRFHYDTGGRVDSVEMKVNGWGELDAIRGAAGFDVNGHAAEQREIDTTVSASIDSSLYEAVSRAGEGPQLVQELVDVFQWDIDFFALQKGDSFSLVVRKRFSGSDPNGYGPIVAARFIHNGQTFEAFRGETGYYAASGTPLRKQFLRAPLQFTRITSGFSHSRWHPILHVFRPHNGVDYGAPIGTPVMTTADGVVAEVGRKGGEGNFVRIHHSSRIDTMYLHLSRFGKGIKRGTKVTQGQVIGYVGATGLATGPHLDYRVSQDGTWINPLKLKSITPDPLRGNALEVFRANVAHNAPKLATPATAQIAQIAPKRRALFQ